MLRVLSSKLRRYKGLVRDGPAGDSNSSDSLLRNPPPWSDRHTEGGKGATRAGKGGRASPDRGAGARARGATMSGYVDRVLGVLLEDEFALDAYIAVGLTVLFVLGAIAASRLGAEKSKQVKKRAWIITTFSAIACFLLSIYACNEAPISWDFRLRTALMGETSLSRFVVRFFRVQSVLDVLLGLVFYRSELDPLTTYFHHFAYFLLCNWMLKNACSLMFVICCLEELPTFMLGLGKLNGSWRTDLGFGGTYGVLRVFMHSFVCFFVFTYPEQDERLGVMRFNFALTWCLHTYWFHGWIKQQMRLRKGGTNGIAMSKLPDQDPKSPTSSRRSPSLEHSSGGSRSSSKSSSSSISTPKARMNSAEKTI